MFIVYHGTASATQPTDDDSRVDLGQYDPGDHFGTSNIMREETHHAQPHHVNVTAATPLKCLVLHRANFGVLLPVVQHRLSVEIVHRQWLIKHRNKVALSKLEKGEMLGTGTYGRVRLAIDKGSAQPYAVKIIDKAKILTAKEEVTNIKNERALLATCNHPFLLKLVAAYQSKKALYLIVELVIGGELMTLLQVLQIRIRNRARARIIELIIGGKLFLEQHPSPNPSPNRWPLRARFLPL